MPDGSSVNRARTMFLFIMLVMCTILHGISVAPIYIPAIGKVLSLIGAVAR